MRATLDGGHASLTTSNSSSPCVGMARASARRYNGGRSLKRDDPLLGRRLATNYRCYFLRVPWIKAAPVRKRRRMCHAHANLKHCALCVLCHQSRIDSVPAKRCSTRASIIFHSERGRMMLEGNGSPNKSKASRNRKGGFKEQHVKRTPAVPFAGFIFV